MKLMKRMTALLLCFLMLSSGPISAFAQTDVSGNDIVVDEETITATATEEVCEECGSSDVHTDACSLPMETESADDRPCNCGENAPENLADHADSCPRKQYVKTLFAGKTAEEIYAEWRNYDEALRTDLLNMVERWDKMKYEALKKLLDGSIPDVGAEIEPGDAEAILDKMQELSEAVEQVTSYEECVDFYDQMMDAYGKAFENDVLLVTIDKLAEIDTQFDELEDYLLNEFGYTHYHRQSTAALFSLSRAGSGTGTGETSGGEIILDKNVTTTPDGQGEFLLELSAYATGADREVSKPTDIVLVIDQSASMYSPVGFASSLNHNELYTGGDGNTAVEQYELSEVIDMFKSTDVDDAGLTYKDKFSQLGYLVAQSKVSGKFYCDLYDNDKDADYSSTHVHTDSCNMLTTYDIYVVQYVEEDADGTPWYFYRVPNTSSPSRDADSWQGDGSEEALARYDLIKMSEDEVGNNHFYFYKSQYGALYDAMTAYVDSVIKDNVGHRLAVVGFASWNVSDYKHHSTGSRLYNNGSYKLYDQKVANYAEDSDYKNALVDVNGNETSIWNSVNAVTTDFYGTCHYAGFDMAYKILNANKTEGRDQIVILFTDGSPSCDNGCSRNTHDTVAKAKEIKDLGAQVYTICTSMVGNADFMKYSSSDYPDAEDKTNSTNSKPIDTPKYAIQVANSEGLANAFDSIEVSSTSVKLGTGAALKDVITKYFVLPAELTTALEDKSETEAAELIKGYINIYTADYTGQKDTMGNRVYEARVPFADAQVKLIKDASGAYRTIQVMNFDYSANYISDVARGESNNYFGCKLIVTIPIDPNPDFLGGDDVVTNESGSGIYESESDTEAEVIFPVPDVDVNVSLIEPIFTSRDIYLSQLAVLPEIMNIGCFTQGGNEYKIDGINNAYVNIVYTLKEIVPGEPITGESITCTIPAGTTYTDLTDHNWNVPDGLNTHPLLKEDTTYTITCTVTSTKDSENCSYKEKDQKVRVFKPEITFSDSEIELGETADYRNNDGTVVWKHGNEVANPDVMGIAPTLEYTYSPLAGAFTEETAVKVTVTAINNETTVPVNQDITQYVTFYRNACTFDGCGNTIINQIDATNENRVNFVVHLKTFDLVISKEGVETVDENQTFLFRVTGSDSFTMDVMIVGNGSVTISGLSVGEYTVTELTDWSWRYTPDAESKEVDSDNATKGVASVLFTNTRTEEYWLSGDCWCENWWGGESGTKVVKRDKSNNVIN